MREVFTGDSEVLHAGAPNAVLAPILGTRSVLTSDGATPSYTWLPFGGGIRRCIRATFANLEMQEVLKAVFTGVALRAVGSRHERPRRRTVTSVPARGTRVIVDARLPSLR